MTARELARWLRIVSGNRLVNMGPDWMNTGNGGTRFGGEFCTPIGRLERATLALADAVSRGPI